MADGIDVVTNAIAWTVKFHSGGGSALPYQLWPGATDLLQKKPFLPRRMVATMVGGSAGNQIVIQDSASSSDWARFVAGSDDFIQPLEWKRATYEQGPMTTTITQFDAGWELIIYF